MPHPVELTHLVAYTALPEQLARDPWKLLVAVTLLNKTTGRLAIPILWKVLDRWPDPWALSQGVPAWKSRVQLVIPEYPADQPELLSTIQSLGTQNIRSRRLINMSMAYLHDPPALPDLRPSQPRLPSPVKSRRYPATPISHLPGTGPYALDSYRIFCTVCHDPLSQEWKYVLPSDKELVRYLVSYVIITVMFGTSSYMYLRNGSGLS